MFGTLVSDMQTDVSVNGSRFSGTIKYLSEGALVDAWGAGHFLAIKVSDIYEDATSVKVGMDPTAGSGLVEIINDPDKNGAFKITDKDTQVFKCVTSDGEHERVQTFNLSDLVLEDAPEDTEEVED